ncbi:MAG TPA: DUF4149 domain-containing protein [Candidatus Binataceae bacterium]|nr:DUF4149 domain-containing protein [Candidatus Binataceae bacterium]
MFSLRILILFVHVAAVIVALGGSLFSTFALTPILARELEPAIRIKVVRRVIRTLGAIVLTALAILVVTGFGNLLYYGAVTLTLAFKLVLVVVVILVALFQYANLGMRIDRMSAGGPSPELTSILARFRRIGIINGVLVLAIVYLSLTLTRETNQVVLMPMQ